MMGTSKRVAVWLVVAGVLAAGGSGIGAQEAPRLRAEVEQEAFAMATHRVANADTWRALVKKAGAHVDVVLPWLGRVGAEELGPVVAEVLADDDRVWSPGLRRSAALAVSLLSDPDLLAPLALRVGPAALARAVGGVGKLPGDEAVRERVVAAMRRPRRADDVEDPRRITDPVVARLLYGSRIAAPLFIEDARAILAAEDKSLGHRRAALYYLARHPKRPARALFGALSAHVLHADPICAARAARALGRLEGAGELDARILAVALEKGGPRNVQVARLRALGSLPPPGSQAVILKLLTGDDPFLRRTAFETVATLAPRMSTKDRAGCAVVALTVADQDPVTDVRRVAVAALAKLTRKTFLDAVPRWSLGAPRLVRIGVAEGLAGLSWADVGPLGKQTRRFVKRLGRDPDRRVMIPLLEAAAKKVGSEDPSEAEFALEASRCAVFGFAMSIGVYRRWTAGAPGAGADPVIVGLFARILEGAVRAAGQDRTFHGATLHLDAFIAGGAKVAPVAESETWQALLDLAAAWKGEVGMKVLRQAATGPSPALRLRAGGHLGTLGVPVPELPSHFREAFGGPRRTRVTRATIRTTRGAITVRLFPNQAPITVHNFVTLAGRGYFDGILFHRVVPAFVAQAGCPRGDGWGGPGHVIPCEVNDLTYRRGTLGMALAGKDTGGSQWFLCHEPQPRLDLRYTIFGEIQDGWDVLDALLPEDVILGVEVSEGR